MSSAPDSTAPDSTAPEFAAPDSTASATGRRVVVIGTNMRPLLATLLDRFEVVGLVRSMPRAADADRGLGGASRRMLRRCAANLRSTWTGTGLPTMRRAARQAGCPYYQLDADSNAGFAAWLQDRAPDLLVVACMTHLLPARVLAIPPLGAINIHPALLPRYRGPHPLLWMFHADDRTAGVTIHYLDPGEDTGDIIHQQAFEVAEGSTIPEVLEHALDRLGPPLLCRAVDEVLAGHAPRTPQPAASPTVRARNPRPDELLVDWDRWDAGRVFRFLRATAGGYAGLPPAGGWWRRWAVLGHDPQPAPDRRPGQLFEAGGRTFVACRDGRVELARRRAGQAHRRAAIPTNRR